MLFFRVCGCALCFYFMVRLIGWFGFGLFGVAAIGRIGFVAFFTVLRDCGACWVLLLCFAFRMLD